MYKLAHLKKINSCLLSVFLVSCVVSDVKIKNNEQYRQGPDFMDRPL